MLALTDLPTCPGLFYGSRARDGVLSRMRIPGGMLNVQQCWSIANLVDRYSTGFLQVTNRANLQIRELHSEIPPSIWQDLQELGLASRRVEVDPIRNIMASPTAGIDRQQLLDTRPLVAAWDNYLQTHPELSELSAKFSIGFDGGELVSIRNLRNDILLAAERISTNPEIFFRLYLNSDTGILIEQSQCIAVLASLTSAYLEYTKNSPRINRKKPRLRHLLADWGTEKYLKKVEKNLPFALRRESRELSETNISHNSCATGILPVTDAIFTLAPNGNLGIHPQRQSDFSYIGIALPLGKLESKQLRNLANLAQNLASGTLRLTPWQNLVISDIPSSQIFEVKQQIADLGLHSSATNLDSCLVACAGSSGCASAATDTQTHALEMVRDLAQKLTIDRSINIHFSGCEKSCAQHQPIDITLVGTQIQQGCETIAAYNIYAGKKDLPFGRQIFPAVSAAQMPRAIERMLRVYQQLREPHESLGEFCDRWAIDKLQKLLSPVTHN
ncbi:MAG: precorrin-3B synthase [Microcoleus sp. PH2017_10_PVI_O_A]|uniref:precorrin-3B synthase n=1 Tax=unclassified Microcoleus TaxID=2642155 RepID=UPI001E049076|nr:MULTISPECIES: precorrin-3B synthase [unclassified Microcoleus]TAE85714.1 MAG: precorrin-3B synthase [Oscillatoriales cyanobacterium]MCC3409925.1 precorrin-3B synthase [Microcoleus sp. PH2017_10_PVI_O_A]MCC3458370.1 precorrin-3B synthase [Microcoleus sp. PH2017_11_PCY_U_A]MCC3478442.1 precorrin-3B synthase [Microcoleus sp. PH2017_12_PCY_D_A]MCC3532310.1 precorrin-3B synthase [Microcoleus sp. PH2017_21_RUC_O_A]